LTTASTDRYQFIRRQENGDEFKRYLQGILNQYHETAYPQMRVPDSKKLVLHVQDQTGEIVGGAILYAYWGWLEISLLALEEQARGQGLGRRLMALIEEVARQEGCTRIRTESFERETFGFYRKLGYRIVGHLEDYPEGYGYYWLRKDLPGVHEPEMDDV
jgi:GNAT superfamily N-acetyltransferase